MVGFVKGVFGGDSLDLSAVTLTPDKALAGTKFYDADGILRTGTIPSKAASTITLAGTATSITVGQYLSGAQTIAWDSDIVAGNIKNGTNIFGVTGTYPYNGLFSPISATQTYTISNLPFTPSNIMLICKNINTSSWPVVISHFSKERITHIIDSSWEITISSGYNMTTFGTNFVSLDFSAISGYLGAMMYYYVVW